MKTRMKPFETKKPEKKKKKNEKEEELISHMKLGF
jgi:hypothetical protein